MRHRAHVLTALATIVAYGTVLLIPASVGAAAITHPPDGLTPTPCPRSRAPARPSAEWPPWARCRAAGRRLSSRQYAQHRQLVVTASEVIAFRKRSSTKRTHPGG
jgi:hypothetical protein